MNRAARHARAIVAALTAVLSLSVAGGAAAQGFFYAEETRDGRIYVFNNAANWERFKASGETPEKGMTQPGAGPNGETVFADNETALELFFFKHGISRPVPRPSPRTQRVEWRDGKTRLTLGDTFYLEISNRIMPRFTYESPDGSIELPGTGGPGEGKGSFRIRRAKFKLEGWFYKSSLEYTFQVNWPQVASGSAALWFEDASIDWDLSKDNKKRFRVHFGQFKAPYGRQQITSSGALQFVDRGIQDERFNESRETGLALWGTLGRDTLDWRVVVSNGNGRSQPANDNDRFLYTGRLMWQALGSVRMNQWGSGVLLTEGDLGESLAAGGPLLAVAGQFSNNDRHLTTTGNDLDNHTWGLDYTFKHRGFASVAEAHWRRSRPESGPSFDNDGFLVQASYAWKAPGVTGASFWEVALRYARIDPSSLAGGDLQEEKGVALSYYYNRHNLKVQADWRQLEDDAADSGRGTKRHELRLQAQFVF